MVLEAMGGVGPGKVSLKLGSQYSKRRDTLLLNARELISDDQKNFVVAGKALEKLFPESYMRDWKTYPGESTPALILRDRLDAARRAAINGDQRPGYIDMDFRSTAPAADRQKSARLVVLSVVLSADPLANHVVSTEMCSFAAVPWPKNKSDKEEMDNFETLLEGCNTFHWNESGWSDGNNPSLRVLDLLQEAMGVVLTGTNAAGGPLIPSGDGRPCNEPGLNPHDELHRALRDLLRHVSVFGETASQWLDTHQYDSIEDRKEQRTWLLDYNRQWWNTWVPAVNRVRDAIPNAQRAELKDLNNETLIALAKLNRIFNQALMYLPDEKPGDHLLLRPLSVLGFQREDDRYLVSNYPSEEIRIALRPIHVHLEALGLYLDEQITLSIENEQAVVGSEVVDEAVSKPGGHKRPMPYETATMKALAIARAEGWPRWKGKPSLRRMAKKVRCSPHTLSKALDNSKELRHLRDRDVFAQPTETAELARLMLEQEQDAKSDRF